MTKDDFEALLQIKMEETYSSSQFINHMKNPLSFGTADYFTYLVAQKMIEVLYNKIQELEHQIKQSCDTIQVMGKAINKGKERSSQLNNMYTSLGIQYRVLLAKTVPHLKYTDSISGDNSGEVPQLIAEINEVLNG